MKKILSGLFMSVLLVQAGLCIDLDMSVNEQIKKQYNSTKLSDEVLPNLPSNLSKTRSNASTTVPSSSYVYSTTPINISTNYVKTGKKLAGGTKFQVKSSSQISSAMSKGVNVTFNTILPVSKKQVTIPAGTTFYGKISDSHLPQITGNGGLVEIDITAMSYNSNIIAVDGKITKVNGKKVFFNSIKGKRLYISNTGKQIDKGEKFYQKAKNVSNKMSKNPIGQVLSPIPTIFGIGSYAVMTVVSPIVSVKDKGGNITIPAGSVFEIKLKSSVEL